MLEGNFSKSLEILSPLLDNGDASIFGWELAIHALNNLRQGSAASTILQRAITLYPHDNRILGRQVLYALTNRQPILGRRYSLLERLNSPDGWNILDRRRSHQNLAYSYEKWWTG